MTQPGNAEALLSHQPDQMARPTPDREPREGQPPPLASLPDTLEMLNALLEALAEGAVVVDRQGHIVLVNQQAEIIFGYARDEMLGSPLAMLLPEHVVELHNQYLSAYFQQPRSRPMGQGLELVGRRKDGREFPADISLSVLNTQAGPLVLALVTDITRTKETERALKRRNEELDAFAHTVAHDLNASLALMVGYSQVLLESYDTLPAEQRHTFLDIIFQTGRKMRSVVDELLLLASMHRDDVPVTPLNMTEIVRHALQRLEHLSAEYRADILLPDGYPTALGYAPWVEEVWLNYLSNALKYGGYPPRIELGGQPQADGYVRFWVRDNGDGLTPEQQARLFTPYTRLGPSHIKGHGLGLSIVQRIVEKLGGQVGVESAPGQGSLFFFSLPAAPKERSPHPG